MNLSYTDAKPIAVFLAFFFTMTILDCCANAYYSTVTVEDPIPFFSSEWVSIRHTRNVTDYLRSNGHVDDRVSDEDLEYICQLATQLSDYYDNIPWHLAIATIAIESAFQSDCYYEGAMGLMQLLPYYHAERLIQCIEEDERYSDKLFYTPRLNVMTGLDYLSQLIDECDGDVSYALMCYNQGPSSAYRTYMKSHITSDYAKNILRLSEELSEL